MQNAAYRGVEALMEHQRWQSLQSSIAEGQSLRLSGVAGSSFAFMAGLLLESIHRPAILIVPDEDELSPLLDELRVWTRKRELYLFPPVAPEITNLEHAPLLQQMKSLRAMMEPGSEKGIWVTTAEAMSAPTFNLDFIDQPALVLEIAQEIETDTLLQSLEERGFKRQDKVDQKGDYAMRGGILDIFPRFANAPVRIELFGDEIETIREFNLITQRSIRNLQRFTLDDLDYQSIEGLRRESPIEDYLPEEVLLFILEPDLIGRDSPPDQRERIERWFQEGSSRQSLLIGHSIENADVDLNFKTLDPEGLTLSEATQKLEQVSKEAEVFLVQEYGSKLSWDLDSKIWCLEGRLQGSFEGEGIQVWHESHLIQLQDTLEDSKEDWKSDFIDLEIGEIIVHEKYGIGRFLGLTSLEKNDTTSDYLLLQFAGQTKIYTSTNDLQLVQKYIGYGETEPQLSRVGTKSWELKKKKAKKAIDRIVMELVDRQAFRQQQNGYSYSKDTKEQRLFEQEFPYVETSCQLNAIARIKKGMEKDLPMDHLLCGDVGFGKTEVAIRAAHKAMLDSKQVAVLAPTTVLAEQHYRTFLNRFDGHEEKVGLISRFRTTAQNQQSLNRLASGDLMVLIGTHRLLSRDVEFADAGLLIIDEEQRFGVKQKEAIKKKYPSIDVLSLSATPIPRTLHLSMLGIREVSNLTVPPENRLSIRTYIREFSKGIIAHAIQRELDRGGQAYFLHNRVEDIEGVRDYLQNLFPKARIGVGHGQMGEKELAQVMQDFYSLKYDIFLATSIIANGIDIPTANTMIINNAHLFGLSELHQIRGRIGRYNLQAYAYLLVPPGQTISKDSLRRLRAIEEHQELGSGFKLAMKDMEIRGVGNILGEDQHGQIADIGYELYTKYLSQAIEDSRGEKKPGLRECELQWPSGSTYIPQTYIPSNTDRIDFYRRISFARRPESLDGIGIEMKDRFGSLAPPVQKLLRFFKAKIELLQLQFSSFKRRSNGLLAAVETHEWQDDKKLAWVMAYNKELAFEGEERILLRVDKIWDRQQVQEAENDPYTRYSYYNDDLKRDPLEVLEAVVQFCRESLKQIENKTPVVEKESTI